MTRPSLSSRPYTHTAVFFGEARKLPYAHSSHTSESSSAFFSRICTSFAKTEEYAPLPTQKLSQALWQFTFGDLETSITNHESASSRARLPLTRVSRVAEHWPLVVDHRPLVIGMSFMTEYLKPATPSRNLLLKPYILWLRDSEMFPTAGVYSGHLSSQGLQVQTLKPGEANSCNPLLQSF